MTLLRRRKLDPYNDKDRDLMGRQFTARCLAAVWVMMHAGEPYARIEEELALPAGTLVVNVRMWERSYAASTLRIGDGEREAKRGGWRAEIRTVEKALGYRRGLLRRLRDWITNKGPSESAQRVRWGILTKAVAELPDDGAGWYEKPKDRERP